ncbi:conserved hypothetical protein [Leishmania mexicana MHOM/GT/2001/U1103]|uniref:RNA-editing substrate-binding complex 6 protein domain-containing protein n=1 Tax=Leishmania mexicana (strain MHOM/GT/2001/U1103) TaxID=929439 RepID=E9ASG1_LEIMU|nr:conserved hypothetical protein [Leishmania mexicana MHOM/GT/2001/U1103]CBZ25884.1 conserved hypothetical protein [Leishmania mexicana MHOM/GT/2001/U1103]
MRRRLACWPIAALAVARAITTNSFVSSIEQVQQQLQTAQDRRVELLRYGRQLYEVEVLDDLKTAYTPAVASKVCYVASQLRIDATKGQPYSAVLEAAMTAEGEQTMDVASLARIVHSCLVLRSEHLHEVLFTFIPFLREKAGAMDAVTTAVLINAYGRSGVQHPGLYKALCDNGATVLKDPRVPLAHIANVAYAVSRVKFLHPALMLTLRDHALRKVTEASPIISLTVLEAFTELRQIDEDLFSAYEQRLLGQLNELHAPLMASLVSCVVRAGRGKAEVMESLGARTVAIADTFDAASIAKVTNAYYEADVASEDVLGALAERACKVAADFRADEIATVLNALSAFDLFDAELFPLLASRFVALHRQGGYVDVADAAVILSSFAAVQERNDELIYVCTQLFAAYPGVAMDPAVRVNALWACASLNVHNEAQTKMLEEVRATPSLVKWESKADMLPKAKATLEERTQFLAKVYGITISSSGAR